VEKIKSLTFRMPHSTWRYFKQMALDHEMPLTELMLNILMKHKESSKKMLTGRDTKV